MKFSCHTLLRPSVLFVLLFASCAQVQTHKNIRTAGQYYQGFQLTKPQHVYLSEGVWYLKTEKITLKENYPLINDPFFLEIGAPQYEKVGKNQGSTYQSISKNTATILRCNDGFYELSMLADNIKKTSKLQIKDINPKKEYPVLAKIDGDSTYVLLYQDHKKPKQNITYLSLSYLDRLLIDLPASIIYNISIPFITPFVFFNNFKKDNEENPLN